MRFSHSKSSQSKDVSTWSRATYASSSFHRDSILRQSRGWILWRLKHGFGFNRRRGLFGFGDSGAAVGTGTVAKQLTNQTLFVAFSVGGGNHFQTDKWGTHCLTEHFLGSERTRRGKKKKDRGRQRGELLVQITESRENVIFSNKLVEF